MRVLRFVNLISAVFFTAGICAQPFFTPVGESAGLNQNERANFGNPIWGDMNNDNFIDLIIPHHGQEPNIYINNGDGTFTERTPTETFGIEYSNEWHDWHGFSFTDFNNDKILDLFITLGARQGDPDFSKRDLLYQGTGDGTFNLVSTEAGVENPQGRGRSSCWFDYDGDGNLDFLVKNLLSPNPFYLNSGAGTFNDISSSVGVETIEEGAVCALVDYDNDGLLDIFLVAGGLDDTLLRQLPDGTFSDVTAAANIAAIGHGTATAWGDYNNDGFMDAYIARAAPSSFTGPVADLDLENHLYLNNGDGTFTDVTVAAGIAGSFNTGAASWGDVDNDGDLDLFVVNAGEFDGTNNLNFLYINNSDGTFTESAALFNIDGQADTGEHRYVGAAFGDYDNDGAIDLILDGEGFNRDRGTSELYRNEGNTNNFLKVKMIGRRANAAAIGSVVSIDTVPAQMHQHTGATYGVRNSQSLQPVHFGLGVSTSVALNVVWPAGALVREQTVTNLASNQTVVIEEGRSIVRGKPDEIADAGCNVWRNFQGWTMSCMGTATQRTSFTGTITTNGELTSVNLVRLESNDSVTSDSTSIAFNLFARGRDDTINFTTTGDTVTLDILQDGVHQPRSIRIGGQKILPGTLPVTLVE